MDIMAAEQKTDPDVAFAWEAPEGNFNSAQVWTVQAHCKKLMQVSIDSDINRGILDPTVYYIKI